MTLQDYIRDATREINDAIKLIDKKRESLINERLGAEGTIKRIGSVISEQHKTQNEKKKEVHGIDIRLVEINKQIDEIEKQKRLLLEQLNEFKGNLDQAKSSLAQVEQESINSQRQINSEKKSIQQFDNRIEEIETERNRYAQRFRLAHVSAFKLFLKNGNTLIEEYFKRITSRKTILEAAQQLNKKRHEDTHVADLCDARDKWKKILKTAIVPSVKEAGDKALKSIEVEINKMFPGALEEIDSTKKENNPTTELYFHEDEEGTVIFFPFLKEQWKAMEKGNKDVSVETFARFIELITTESKLRYSDAYLKCENDMVQMVCQSGLGNLKNKNDITFSIIGKDSVTFILSPIPDEVYKSLNYEDATS